MIEIRKGVPLPKRLKPVGLVAYRGKYPWAALEVGDSFKLDSAKVTCAAANKRFAPKRFITRLIDGKRWVWRIA